MAATSGTTPAGLVQLARSVRDDVVAPAVAERWPSAGRGGSGEVPELYRPVGGPQDRARYQQMAEASGWS